jgi:hypothetical protein
MPNAASTTFRPAARVRPAPRHGRAGRTETARLLAAAGLLASGVELHAAARRVGVGRSRLRRKLAHDRRLKEAVARLGGRTSDTISG